MRKSRILVADDSAEQRRVLRKLLAGSSHLEICGEAVDGMDAVEQATALYPDLVILDLDMPRLNGLEAARKIHAAMPALPLLLMTFHHIDPDLQKEARQAGFQGTLCKSSSDLIHHAATDLLQGKSYFALS